MSPFLYADNFLAGSILSLLLPTGLLIAIAIWYFVAVKRVPEDTPAASSALPSPEVIAAADPEAEDNQAIPPVSES